MGLFNRKKAAAKAEEAAAKVKETAAAAEEKAEEIVEAVEEKAEEVAAAVEEKAEAVVEAVEEKAEEVAAAVEETFAPAEEAPAEEAPVEEAPAEEAPAEEAPEAPELTPKENGDVFECTMKYHAGYNVYKTWPNGGMTIHAGIGWFHPFGPSEYYGMASVPGNECEESKLFPLETCFTEDWMKNFETDLFCIYRLEDGDIYAWDGIFACRGIDPGKCIGFNSELQRQDVLINVIVGGTGRYEGARGLMIGTAEGAGAGKVCGEWPDGSPLELPETIMKDLQGYIRIPPKD